ncbi:MULTISPECIES: hypothetical protein [unclassified Phaeobacter]|uniref:hypothetical protein n=1 Tax=unclassified Phaeobacter TaxID=2621772 RepID=UPI003A872567
MRVESPIAAAAIVASLPFGAVAHPRLPFDLPLEEAPRIAAPFSEKTTYIISVQDAAQLSKRQQLLSGSSTESARVSFKASMPDDGTLSERSPSELIVELKRLSGLTWAQISDVFEVDSRALHYWKAGKRVSAENHQKLGSAVAMLRFIDRGTAEENKQLLLSNEKDGNTLLELMKVGEFQAIMDIAGKGAGRVSFGRTLTDDARLKNSSQGYQPSAEVSERVEVELLERPQTRRKKLRRGKA